MQEVSTDQWLPCKEASHNVLLQEIKVKLWSLWLHESITGKRKLIAAANKLQKVIDAMEAAGRDGTQ